MGYLFTVDILFTCRELKDLIVSLGANQHPAAIERLGKCISFYWALTKQFLESVGRQSETDKHSRPRNRKDIAIMLHKLVDECNALGFTQGRKLHKSYKSVMHREQTHSYTSWLRGVMKDIVLF